jgi:hypothetical protein
MSGRDWNAVRFERDAGADHVESYFLKLNEPRARRALWLKATILAGRYRDPVAEGWAIAFDRESGHVAAKEVVPYSEARFSPDALDVRVRDVEIRPGFTRGKLEARGHRIEWELEFDATGPALTLLPTAKMYQGKFPSSKLVTPFPDTRYSGFYRVDGREVKVDGWRGMQGHNWGRRHAQLYGWGHVNQWDGDAPVMMEGVTARVKMGPVLVPPLTIVCVWHEGARYEFNSVRTMLRNTGSVALRSWKFEAETHRAKLRGELSATTDDMVGLYYENPDGDMTYCLNSKIARAWLRLEPASGPPLEVTSRAAALEIGTRDPKHGVRMLA